MDIALFDVTPVIYFQSSDWFFFQVEVYLFAINHIEIPVNIL